MNFLIVAEAEDENEIMIEEDLPENGKSSIKYWLFLKCLLGSKRRMQLFF